MPIRIIEPDYAKGKMSALERYTERLKKLVQNWIYRLANAGSLPGDTTEQRLRKAVLIFLASIYCIVGALWGITYFTLGPPLSGSIPLGYGSRFCSYSIQRLKS